MRSLGIEEARKSLGDIADQADQYGDITYLTRHGRSIAAVVPALRSRRRDPVRIATDIPAHSTRTEEGTGLETWHCTCGATGVETADEFASTLAAAHEHDAAAPILRALSAGELAETLRLNASDNWRLAAAIELLIAHDVWLHSAPFRAYLEGRWSADGTFLVYVRWSDVCDDLGIYRAAVDVLTRGGAPGKAVDAVRQWAGDHDNGLPALYGSDSENAVLRVAASIANNMPLRLADDTTSLDNRNRGLVLTAIGHMLSRGGGVAFASSTTWPS